MLRGVILLLSFFFLCAPLSTKDLPPSLEKLEPPKPKLEFKVPQTVLPTFQPHVQKFLKIAKKYGKELDISTLVIMFGPTKHVVQEKKGYVTIGYCQHLTGILLIVIDKKNWKAFPYKKREMLAFHEMGHCLLDRDHVDTLNENGQPVSLMNSVIFSDYVYKDHQEYYLKELFTYKDPLFSPVDMPDHDIFNLPHLK